MNNFKIFIHLPVATSDEWGRALSTPVSKLPRLTPEQEERVRRWGISPEDERRNVFRHGLTAQRLETQGSKLGRAVERVLGGLQGPEGTYRLLAVIIDGLHQSLLLRMETPTGVVSIPVAGELWERVVRNGESQDQEELKREILSVLGRTDLLATR